MNYIEWELLRQRAALEGLLFDGLAQAKKIEEQVRLTAETPADDPLLPAESRTRQETAAAAEKGLPAGVERTARDGGTAAEPLPVGKPRAETPAAEPMEREQEGGGALPGTGTARGSGSLPPAQGGGRTGTAPLPAARESGRSGGDILTVSDSAAGAALYPQAAARTSAGEVSRCVEQDARRYDGGFPLY